MIASSLSKAVSAAFLPLLLLIPANFWHPLVKCFHFTHGNLIWKNTHRPQWIQVYLCGYILNCQDQFSVKLNLPIFTSGVPNIRLMGWIRPMVPFHMAPEPPRAFEKQNGHLLWNSRDKMATLIVQAGQNGHPVLETGREIITRLSAWKGWEPMLYIELWLSYWIVG